MLSGLSPCPEGSGRPRPASPPVLIGLGVGQSTAFAIAITHRLITYYLPPIWGYLSLRWLTHKGYV